MKKYLITLTFTSLFFGCAAKDIKYPNIPVISETDYENKLDQNTQKKEVYSGFHNILTFTATLNDGPMMDAQLAKQAEAYQWNETTYQKQKTEMTADLGNKTQVFLSFFTPEKKQNNLSQKSTTWKIYLDIGSQRYEGTATKLKTAYEDLVLIYSYHNKWSTPYKIEFPVGANTIGNQKVKFTITGAVGEGTVDLR